MKVSIITVCYNSIQTVEETIKSVLAQNYNQLEYIIIDGGSTDGTLEIINRYRDALSVVISEPDGGIYDAMNKGLRNATGEVVGILNSDDLYYNESVLEEVAKAFFNNDDVEAVYGNVVISKFEDVSKPVRKWIAGKPKSFLWGWHPPHPGLFLRKSVYDKYGYFNTSYKVSADFELMLRFFVVHKIKAFYLDRILVNMRMGGASTGSIKNILIGNYYVKKAFKENNVTYFWAYPIIRISNKLQQFF
jgi:glycosyltransferase involved in cell wall biosynthesis